MRRLLRDLTFLRGESLLFLRRVGGGHLVCERRLLLGQFRHLLCELRRLLGGLLDRLLLRLVIRLLHLRVQLLRLLRDLVLIVLPLLLFLLRGLLRLLLLLRRLLRHGGIGILSGLLRELIGQLIKALRGLREFLAGGLRILRAGLGFVRALRLRGGIGLRSLCGVFAKLLGKLGQILRRLRQFLLRALRFLTGGLRFVGSGIRLFRHLRILRGLLRLLLGLLLRLLGLLRGFLRVRLRGLGIFPRLARQLEVVSVLINLGGILLAELLHLLRQLPGLLGGLLFRLGQLLLLLRGIRTFRLFGQLRLLVRKVSRLLCQVLRLLRGLLRLLLIRLLRRRGRLLILLRRLFRLRLRLLRILRALLHILLRLLHHLALLCILIQLARVLLLELLRGLLKFLRVLRELRLGLRHFLLLLRRVRLLRLLGDGVLLLRQLRCLLRERTRFLRGLRRCVLRLGLRLLREVRLLLGQRLQLRHILRRLLFLIQLILLLLQRLQRLVQLLRRLLRHLAALLLVVRQGNVLRLVRRGIHEVLRHLLQVLRLPRIGRVLHLLRDLLQQLRRLLRLLLTLLDLLQHLRLNLILLRQLRRLVLDVLLRLRDELLRLFNILPQLLRLRGERLLHERLRIAADADQNFAAAANLRAFHVGGQGVGHLKVEAHLVRTIERQLAKIEHCLAAPQIAGVALARRQRRDLHHRLRLALGPRLDLERRDSEILLHRVSQRQPLVRAQLKLRLHRRIQRDDRRQILHRLDGVSHRAVGDAMLVLQREMPHRVEVWREFRGPFHELLLAFHRQLHPARRLVAHHDLRLRHRAIQLPAHLHLRPRHREDVARHIFPHLRRPGRVGRVIERQRQALRHRPRQHRDAERLRDRLPRRHARRETFLRRRQAQCITGLPVLRLHRTVRLERFDNFLAVRRRHAQFHALGFALHRDLYIQRLLLRDDLRLRQQPDVVRVGIASVPQRRKQPRQQPRHHLRPEHNHRDERRRRRQCRDDRAPRDLRAQFGFRIQLPHVVDGVLHHFAEKIRGTGIFRMPEQFHRGGNPLLHLRVMIFHPSRHRRERNPARKRTQQPRPQRHDRDRQRREREREPNGLRLDRERRIHAHDDQGRDESHGERGKDAFNKLHPPHATNDSLEPRDNGRREISDALFSEG